MSGCPLLIGFLTHLQGVYRKRGILYEVLAGEVADFLWQEQTTKEVLAGVVERRVNWCVHRALLADSLPANVLGPSRAPYPTPISLVVRRPFLVEEVKKRLEEIRKWRKVACLTHTECVIVDARDTDLFTRDRAGKEMVLANLLLELGGLLLQYRDMPSLETAKLIGQTTAEAFLAYNVPSDSLSQACRELAELAHEYRI